MSKKAYDNLVSQALSNLDASEQRAESESLMFQSHDWGARSYCLVEDLAEKHSLHTLRIVARCEYQKRKLRKRFLPSEYFAEGTWNILLDLFEQEAAGVDVCVSSACIASDVPTTTAIRNIAQLVDEGLVCRHRDPKDKRRHFLRLTYGGLRTMRKALTEIFDTEQSLGRT